MADRWNPVTAADGDRGGAGALREAEREALDEGLELVALQVMSKAAVTWGMPLLDILGGEGHDHECDALSSENLTACDCWWGRVKRAAEALSLTATLADDQTGGRIADLPAVVARIRDAAVEAAVAAERAIHRDLTSRLGFGDNITEPQADNDTIVRWYEERMAEASEWVESIRWRDDHAAALARAENAEGGYRQAAEYLDRFRDVLADALGYVDTNPGDDVLLSDLREHFGRTGPEPTRWRDFCTGACAQVDQINAARRRPHRTGPVVTSPDPTTQPETEEQP